VAKQPANGFAIDIGGTWDAWVTCHRATVCCASNGFPAAYEMCDGLMTIASDPPPSLGGNLLPTFKLADTGPGCALYDIAMTIQQYERWSRNRRTWMTAVVSPRSQK
jgi:hypothetical protein